MIDLVVRFKYLINGASDNSLFPSSLKQCLPGEGSSVNKWVIWRRLRQVCSVRTSAGAFMRELTARQEKLKAGRAYVQARREERETAKLS